MRIVSINREQTKAWNQVAFNVDDPLAPEVMRTVKFGVVSMKLSGAVLHCSFADNGTNSALVAKSIERLHEIFDAAQAAADEKAAEAARQHKRLVEQVSQQCGVPID